MPLLTWSNLPYLLPLAILSGGVYIGIFDPHSLPWLLATVVNLALGWFVVRQKPGNEINRTFLLVSVCLSIWTLDVFGFYHIQDPAQMREWLRGLRPGYLFLAPAIFHFMIALSRSTGERVRLYTRIAYAIAFVFLVASFAGLFKDELVVRSGIYFPRMGPVYFLSLLNLAGWSLLGLYFVFRSYRNSRSVRERKQMQYFFWISAGTIALGMIPNTLYSLGAHVYPMGGFVVTLYGIGISYTIVRYQLMDIEIIIRKSIVYALLTLAVISLYALVAGALTGIFSVSVASGRSGWLIHALSGLAIALISLPLRDRIQKTVDRLFFRGKYNYQKTLRDFSVDVASLLELDVLLDLLLAKVTGTMHINGGCVLLYDAERDRYETKRCHGVEAAGVVDMHLSPSHPLVRWLADRKSILIVGDPPDVPGEVTEVLSGAGMRLSLPLIVRGRLIGIFNLGEKRSEEMYSHEDLALLTTIANQASISIENTELSAKMRLLERELHQSDKLSALGTFAASIAHEIKNPLASIKTFCQLVPGRCREEKFIGKFSEVVPSEIDRLETVLGQLLDFKKFSEIDFSPVKVERIIDDLISLVHYEAFNRNVVIVRRYASDMPLIKGSEELLRQVFMNLMLNAIQAMPLGGKLSIAAEVRREREGAGRVSVSFKDTGCGIPEESLPNLFKPFFTTKRNGTGLGLSVVHRIVREHNGTIEVESRLDQGTVFTINLPMNEHLVT